MIVPSAPFRLTLVLICENIEACPSRRSSSTREDETVFVREWLKGLPNKVQRKCLTFITRLEMDGHTLRRPIADFLRDGIYELRPSYQGVHYRILFFFSGKDVVVLSQGITKEAKCPTWRSIGPSSERKI